MKLFPPRSRETTEFIGRTLDEAVRRARRGLGDDAKIRCWKVRRGGLFGFFAHEYFVAGLTPPLGAIGADALDPQGVERVDEVDAHELDRAWNEALGADDPPADSPSEAIALEELIAATGDELALSSDDATRRAFGEVLAQAEALLMRPARSDASSPTYARPESATGFGSTEGVATEEAPIEEVSTGGAWIGTTLRQRLADLGVPDEYLPGDGEGFDALWSRLETLPSVATLGAGAGEVIAVVGSRRDALATAAALVEQWGLAERDVIDAEPSVELRRRVQRRRRSAHTSVIVVEAPVGSATSVATREWLAQLGATQVIGALGAGAKRADVRRWLDQLELVDALACWRLGGLAAVADLMGVAPIYLLDGSAASPMRWFAQLVGALGRSEP